MFVLAVFVVPIVVAILFARHHWKRLSRPSRAMPPLLDMTSPDQLRAAVAALGLGEALRSGRVYIGENPVAAEGPGLLVLYDSELVLVPDGAPPIRIPLQELLFTGPEVFSSLERADSELLVAPLPPPPGLCWRRRKGEDPELIPVLGMWHDTIGEAINAYWKRRSR